MKKRDDGRYMTSIRITEKGKKQRKYFYGSSPAEVRRKVAEYEAGITHASDGSIPFSELADMWCEQHETLVRHNTASCYSAPLKNAKKFFGETPAGEIRPADVQDFINDYSLAKTPKPRARHTVELRINVMSLIYKYGVVNGYVEKSPVTAIRIPPECPTKKRKPPTDEQREAIEGLDAGGFGLYPIFLLYTGLRRGELLALKWEDIDIEKKRIHITKSIDFYGNKPIMKELTKSDAGIRDVPLIESLAKIVRPLAETGSGIIFKGTDGGYMTKGTFTHAWRKLGLNVTAHQLRHSFATQMYEAGLDAEISQKILGVSSVKVVRDIYTEIRESRLEGALEKLNAAETMTEKEPEKV